MDTSLISSSGRSLNLPNTEDGFEQNADRKKGDDVVKDTFDLLEKGEKEIKLDDRYRDAIMILGNTGSGKTTFTQFLAGDNTKLISKETQEGSGEYIIEGPGISNSSLKSETIFPELVIEAKTNAAYYDCPGFGDTQGTSREIAETYFTKKVLDFLRSLKMVLTINHSSVRKGVDRQDFMKLLRHVTDLVKDTEKFKHSFAMVATKVDNQYKKQGNDIILVGDDIVIAAIAGFLLESKQYLEENLKGENISENEKKFYENAIKFVEVLLEKEGEKYPRIGIFRRPDMPGPVSDIKLLQDGKQYLEKIVYEKLNFSVKNNEDFGYTVSEKTKNDIQEIVEEINKNLWFKLSNISVRIQEHCKNLVEKIRGKIELFGSAVNVVDANPSEAKAFKLKFMSAYNSTSELVSKTTNLTNPEDLALLVNTTATILNIDIPENDILYLATQGNYFNFLQTVSDKELNSRSWNQIFKGTETFLSNSKTIILREVDSAAKNISDRIHSKLNDTIKVIHQEYAEKINSIEIQKLPEKLTRDHKIIFEIAEEIKNEITTEKLVSAARYVAENLKVSSPKENLQNIANQGKYLNFLEIISDSAPNIDLKSWLSPFENFATYFFESEKWYTFLEDLYNKFSEYDIQKDRQKYNVADLEDWGQPGKPQGVSITPKTFQTFLDKISHLNVKEHETIQNQTKVTDLQIEEINQALSATLKHRPIIRCSEPHVIVKGSFVSLNETMQNLLSNSDTNNSCKNFTSQLAEGKYDLLQVSALNSMFIDADLSFSGKRISVAIVAPKWKVVESRSIEINGFEGDGPEEPKAKNGVHPGNDGANGVPGNPGASGETFFGIGDTFSGGGNLKIDSNGGKGGFGQNGGDGAQGTNGRDAIKPSRNDPECEAGSFRGFECRLLKREKISFPGLSGYVYTYRIRGESGGRGGDGGDGGKGGHGGRPGIIRTIELSRPSEIRNSTSMGDEGAMGEAGSGGRGAKNGYDVITEFEHSTKIGCIYNCVTMEWMERNEVKENGMSPPGSAGKNGGNIVGLKDAVPAKGISGLAKVINEYKMYLRESLNNRFYKHSLLRFLDQINQSNEVRSLYNIVTLIDEFKGLEEQFHKLSKQVDFALFYNSLLERIWEFAKNLEKDSDSGENKKVLNYLYTATLGRIHYLRETSETSLIIDIRKYLNLIKENIKTLKDLETQNNKVEVINKYKDNYKKGIDKKIEEAMSFIKNTVSPEIEKINEKIEDQVNILIEETIAMQEEAETEIEKLAEKKKELGKSLALKSLFGCFEIIGGMLNFLGPIGKIAGAVIGAANVVGDAFALDPRRALDLPSDIASAIKDIIGQIKSMRDKKAAYLQKLLDDLSEEIKKNPEKLSDLEDKVNDIKEKLQKATENKLDYKQVKTLEKDLSEELKRKGDDLKSKPNDKESLKALKIIEKVAKVLEFGSLLLGVYDKIKEARDKIGVVDDAMRELEKQLRMLREYEDFIYESIAPMLNEMMEHMKDVSNKLGTKSRVALDVTKWRVQSNLKDMRLEMQRLTEGFSVKDDLSRSIEKLDEVMTTLITIYDRIQSYQDQKQLADYIGDISSVAANAINIKNQQLANAVNHLEHKIRANILLEQYKTTVEALKQWVFPFAYHYIEESMLPSQIGQETNLEDLVQNAAKQIEAIKLKIDLYDASVKNGDEYLQCEEFSSQYVSSKPFFVWKNEDFGGLISNLLSGKAVVLKADIEYSSPYKQAIKFSEIDFYFKIKNESAHALLYEVLKGFDIRATHLGHSYYRYDDKTFLITSDSVTITYSYEKNKDGMPIRSNKIYNTLKSGDLLLSPYTLWEARIINKTDQYSFEDLEKFKNETNLELSGFGSYVDANTDRVPANESHQTGLNQCKRSKHRFERSINEMVADDGCITNNAPKSLSSPINSMFNLLKTRFLSNAIASISQMFLGEPRSGGISEGFSYNPNDCNEGSPKNSGDFPDLPNDSTERSQGISEDCFNLINDRTEMTNLGPIEVTTTNTVIDSISAGKCCIKEIPEPNSDINIDVKFNGNNSCSNFFVKSDSKDMRTFPSMQTPDFNCSLLLADLVTRTVTGNRYKSPVKECLMSPREMMLKKMNYGLVRSESEIKQMMQRHLSEKEAEIQSSWLSQLNGYAMSLLQYLGLLRNQGSEEYVQDIRNLFE